MPHLRQKSSCHGAVARASLAELGAQRGRLKEQILEFDRIVMAWHRSNEVSRRLDAIPGVGPMLAIHLDGSLRMTSAVRQKFAIRALDALRQQSAA
jgi:transposase